MIRFERDRTCVWLPADASPSPLSKPPAILFLHGIGERGGGGAELPLVCRWGLPKLRGHPLKPVSPFPFLVVAPQCPADARWSSPPVLAALEALLDNVIASGEADPRRVSLAGFSMGGVGAFCLALSAPRRFAALVSVCGACDDAERLDELAHLPLWIAWAEDDEIAQLTDGSREVVARLQGWGRLIARPYHLGSLRGNGAHVRTADAAFAEPDMYRWLASVPTADRGMR